MCATHYRIRTQIARLVGQHGAHLGPVDPNVFPMNLAIRVGFAMAGVWLRYTRRSVFSGIIGHYGDVIMTRMASWITSLTIVYSIVYSGEDQRKLQSSASLAFVRWIHRRPVNSPHKWPVTRKMFPFDDVIMVYPVKYPSHKGGCRFHDTIYSGDPYFLPWPLCNSIILQLTYV